MMFRTIWDRYGALATSARRVLTRDIFPILFSTGCRALFGLVFSTILVSRYPPATSVELFQLLLLQTIFVIFVSGSGYGRAVAASETESGLAKLVRGYLLFALVTLAFVTLLETSILPRELAARFIAPERWKIYALMAGGVATGLHSILQGALVRKWGAGRMFYPAAGVNLLFVPLLLFFRNLDENALLGMFVVVQFAVLLVFLITNPMAIRLLLKGLQWGEGKLAIGASTESLSFGTVNAMALLLFFLFRELWSDRVDARVAEAAFFGIRISEIYLGIMYQVVANSTWLRPFRYEHRVAPRTIGMIAAAILALTALLILLVFLGSLLEAALPLIVLALGLQLLCEGLRIPGSMATLFELQHGTSLRYFLIAIPPIAAAAAVSLWTTSLLPLFSFYLFQLIMSALQIGSALLSRAIFEFRRAGAG